MSKPWNIGCGKCSPTDSLPIVTRTAPLEYPRRAGTAEIVIATGISLLVLAVLYAFIPYAVGYGASRTTVLTFANWVWSGGEDWQHCYLVPLAFAGMVWWDRRRLLSLPLERAWTGLAVLALGFFVYWAGYRVDNVYIAYGSFQILVGGLILWFFGWKWMLALAFPWIFLVFLYPLPFLDNFVAFPLRMVMSNSAVTVLDFMGVDVVQRGTGILSAPESMLGLAAGEKFSVDVADPCSGIRSLFALMMVAALYGHFTLKSWWQKLILFASSIPLAIVGNLVRILTLTFGTIAFGSEFAIGKHALTEPSWFHMAAGYVVFAVAFGGMLGMAWLLKNGGKIPARLSNARRSIPAPPPPPPAGVAKPVPSHSDDVY